MEKWVIVVVFILAIVIGVFIFLTLYYDQRNNHSHQRNILYPFSGNLPAPNAFGKNPEDGLELLNASKEPQIQCPVGYHVNIVGAWVEVNDPFSECTHKPSDIFLSTCGIKQSDVKCATDSDCGEGMTCGSQGVCVHKKCSTDKDCGAQKDPAKGVSLTCVGGKCVQSPTCGPDTIDPHTGVNYACSPNNTHTNCKPRDASAYLAKHCNGKAHCLAFDDKWKPNDPKNNPFGPLPCTIPASSTNHFYTKLPAISGWAGGTPHRGKKQSPASFNQGYYVHGVYTCIPDDES